MLPESSVDKILTKDDPKVKSLDDLMKSANKDVGFKKLVKEKRQVLKRIKLAGAKVTISKTKRHKGNTWHKGTPHVHITGSEHFKDVDVPLEDVNTVLNIKEDKAMYINQKDAMRERKIDWIINARKILRELKARQYVKSLYEFNTEVLDIEGTLKEGSKMVHLSPAHRDMCQFIDEDPKKFKLLLFPRGHLKSTVVTVGHSVRRICENPQVRILIANATYGLACTFLDQIKSHLKGNKKIHELYSDFSQGADKWSENQIKIFRPGETVDFETKEPTVTAMGVTGSLTSQHYDIIIADDLVNRENVNNLDQIKKVRKFYQDALDLLEPGGEFIMIGTRWHDVDLYGWIMEGDTEKPPEIPKSVSREIMPYQFVYKGENFNIMKRKVVEGGKAIWPEKFTDRHIQMLKQQKGPYEFSSQYNNEPVADEDQTFRRDWFKYYISDDVKGRNVKTYTMIDPAISQEDSADYTVITTVSVDEGMNWYIREIIRERMLPNQLIEEMFNVYERWYPESIGIEVVAFQKMLVMNFNEEMKKRKKYLPILELKPDQNRKKEARIMSLQPGYYNGKIFHLEHGLNLDYLEDELLRFPRGTHDDIIDTLAYLTTFATPPTPNARKANRSNTRRYLY